MSLPGAVGSTVLPIGVQLIGRPGRDAELLAITAWLAEFGVAPRAVPCEPACQTT